MKNKKKNWIFWGLFTIVSLSLLLVIIFMTINKETYELESRQEKIKEAKEDFPKNEVLGWVRVEGTDIDDAVLDSEMIDGTYEDTYAWLDTVSSKEKDHWYIYGHNIRNVSSYPLIRNKEHNRFEQLLGFVYDDYAKDNKYIQYSTSEEEGIYKIYAISFVDTIELMELKNKDKEEYINQAKEESFYDYDVEVDDSDTLLTLVTCTRFFDSSANYQFRIEARLLRKNEKTVDYEMKINDNYNRIEEKLKEGEDNEKNTFKQDA